MYYIKINKLITESIQKDYFSKNDLFIRINYLEDNMIKSRKTQVIYNNNKPIWNEIFILDKPNNIEILLYEKGKFIDKLINTSKIIKNNNKIEKIVCNKIEIYHGEIILEDKEIKQNIIIENDNLKKEIINNKKTIEELNSNIIEKESEIKNLNNLLKQLNLVNISLKQDNVLKKKIIEKIEKLIINI